MDRWTNDPFEWIRKSWNGFGQLVEAYMGVESWGAKGELPCTGLALYLSSSTKSVVFNAGFQHVREGSWEEVQQPFREDERGNEPFMPRTSQINIRGILEELGRARVMVELITDNVNFPHVQADTVVSTLLPEFVLSDAFYTTAITVDDLICHTSGLPNAPALQLGFTSYDDVEPARVVAALRTVVITDEHRGGFFPSVLNGILLEYLINRLTNGRFEALMQETCGWPMTSSSRLAERATAYWGDEDQPDADIRWRPIPASPTGEPFATARDLMKFAENLFRPELGFTSRAKLKEMMRSRMSTIDNGEEIRIAAGVHWCRKHGVKIVGKQMVSGGYGSFVFFLPKHDLVGVVVGNVWTAECIGIEIAIKIAEGIVDGFKE